MDVVHVLGLTTNIKEMKWGDVVQVLGLTTNIKGMKREDVVQVLGHTTNIKKSKLLSKQSYSTGSPTFEGLNGILEQNVSSTTPPPVQGITPTKDN